MQLEWIWWEIFKIFPLTYKSSMRWKTGLELSFIAKMKLRIKTKLIINCIIFIKLFTEKLQIENENITAYLNQISISVLTGEQWETCEGPILENELLKAFKNMSNNKPPGNDGLTKEFYETFWEDLKKPLCASITKAFHRGELSHSQKQAVIKLIEKKRYR